MDSALRLQPLAVHALSFLRDLEEGAGGYLRRQVLGWAHPQDAERATGHSVPEVLPLLRHCGLVERDDVRPPAHRRPVWIYRITDPGKRWVSAHLGRIDDKPLLAPADLADLSIWLVPRARTALAELRRVAHDPRPCNYIPGEHGWRTSQQLEAGARSRAGATDSTTFDTPVLSSLILAELVERRNVVVPWRTRPVVLYRVTPAGGVIPVLEWLHPRDPRNSYEPMRAREHVL